MEKRIEKLEQTIIPQPKLKWMQVIQEVGETRDEALLRAGISPENRDEFNYCFIQIVAPPVRGFISGNN